jgi:hypothetical protein
VPRVTRRPSPAMVVACVALLVALTGTSVAAVSQLVPRNSVGTAQLKGNAVVSTKVKNHSLLALDFKNGQIPAGPPGPPGPPGQTGAAGSPGPGARWALVRKDGGIVVQSGGISLAAKPAAGTYILNFGSPITGKLITTTDALAGDIATRGAIVAGPCGGPPEGGAACAAGNDTSHLSVYTLSTAGLLQDHAFYVGVIG